MRDIYLKHCGGKIVPAQWRVIFFYYFYFIVNNCTFMHICMLVHILFIFSPGYKNCIPFSVLPLPKILNSSGECFVQNGCGSLQHAPQYFSFLFSHWFLSIDFGMVHFSLVTKGGFFLPCY